MLGVEIRLAERIEALDDNGNVVRNSNGEAETSQGRYDNGVILLSLESQDPLMTVAVHETVHRIRELSEGDYAYLKDFVLRNMTDEKLNRANEVNEGLYPAGTDVTEETVANAFGRILGDENKLRQFVRENTTAAQRIFDALGDILDRVKAVLRGETAETRTLTEKQKEIYSDLEAQLGKMLDLYSGALENVRESEGTANDVAKFSISNGRSVLDLDIAWDEDNFSSLKDQLTAHIDEVNAMKPVTTVNYDKSKGKSYSVQLNDILKDRFGYNISRSDGVSFLFDEPAIKSLRSYVGSDEEAAAAIATPYILKRAQTWKDYQRSQKPQAQRVSFNHHRGTCHAERENRGCQCGGTVCG